MKKSLSKNEIVFCRLKVEGKTDLQAAKEAGYVEEYGKNLLKKEYIQNEIKRLQEEKKKEEIANDTDILQFLTSVMKGDAYKEKNDGVMKDRMRAAELLGKRQNVFEQTDSKNDVVIIVDDIVNKGKC
ncbi:MAG: terminase small subunit [Firmicutes bacterium]|jgi:phage terminase small subunit|nr:terminase small subunit [Bacillota bacterium]